MGVCGVGEDEAGKGDANMRIETLWSWIVVFLLGVLIGCAACQSPKNWIEGKAKRIAGEEAARAILEYHNALPARLDAYHDAHRAERARQVAGLAAFAACVLGIIATARRIRRRNGGTG